MEVEVVNIFLVNQLLKFGISFSLRYSIQIFIFLESIRNSIIISVYSSVTSWTCTHHYCRFPSWQFYFRRFWRNRRRCRSRFRTRYCSWRRLNVTGSCLKLARTRLYSNCCFLSFYLLRSICNCFICGLINYFLSCRRKIFCFIFNSSFYSACYFPF